MRILYLDCFSGISGDMTIGALLDLGLPFEVLREGLEQLKLGGYALRYGRGQDGALAGAEFSVELVDDSPVQAVSSAVTPGPSEVTPGDPADPGPASTESPDPVLPGSSATTSRGASAAGALLFVPVRAYVPPRSGAPSTDHGWPGPGHAQSHAHDDAHVHAHTHSVPGHGHAHGDAHLIGHAHPTLANPHGHGHSHGDAHVHGHARPTLANPHGHGHSHGDAQVHGHAPPESGHGHAHGDAHVHGHVHPLDARNGHRQADSAAHTHHGHRTWREIRTLIESSALPASIRDRAVAVFQRLAVAEGRIHDMPPDDVAFHEVGAIDSIVDIVGVAIGLEHLGIDVLVCAPLPVSRGMVDCQHGLLPLPAPATLELLRGAPIYDSGRDVELVTPTGAAIVAALASSFGGMPAMTVDRIGYGLGRRRGHATPNALRAVLGDSVEGARSASAPRFSGTDAAIASSEARDLSTPAHHAGSGVENALIIEANIDDMSPQLYEPLIERLLEQGALDVLLIPAQMKKGRPAHLVQVLCDASRRDALIETLLRESTSIGARFYPVSRVCLERRIVSVETPFGAVRVKLSGRDGAVWNLMPEFEDCRRIALETGVPLKQIHQEALRCALNQGLGVAPSDNASELHQGQERG